MGSKWAIWRRTKTSQQRGYVFKSTEHWWIFYFCYFFIFYCLFFIFQYFFILFEFAKKKNLLNSYKKHLFTYACMHIAGIDAGDSIQLAVKIAYPKEDLQNKKGKVRDLLISVLFYSVLNYYILFYTILYYTILYHTILFHSKLYSILIIFFLYYSCFNWSFCHYV